MDVFFFDSIVNATKKAENEITRLTQDGKKFKFRSYQETAIGFMYKCILNGHGILLFLKPGQGKTLILLSFLYSIVYNLVDLSFLNHTKKANERSRTNLIIAPVGILEDVWLKEARRLFPADKICVYHGTNRPSASEMMKCYIVITSLETLHAEYESQGKKCNLFQLKINHLVVDEAHVLRNGISFSKSLSKEDIKERKGRTKTLELFKQQNCSFAHASTGTVLMNDLSDLVAMARLAAPVGNSSPLNYVRNSHHNSNSKNWWVFGNWVHLSRSAESRTSKIAIIKNMTKDFMFNLTLEEDIASQPILPKCQQLKRVVGFSHTQENRTNSLLQNLRKLLKAQAMKNLEENKNVGEKDTHQRTIEDEHGDSELGTDSLTAQIFTILLRLRQVSNSASLPEYTAALEKGDAKLDTDECIKDSEKFKALIEDLKYELEKFPDELHVISSAWVGCIKMIFHLLAHFFPEQKPLELHGDMTPREVKEVLNKFRSKNRKHRILLVTISKAAVGFDLSVASRLKMIEPGYNVAIQDQMVGRLHRPGQTLPVHVLLYLSQSKITESLVSVDTFIRNLQLFKTRNVIEMLPLTCDPNYVSSIIKNAEQLTLTERKELFTAESVRELTFWDGRSRPTFRTLLEAFLTKKDKQDIEDRKEQLKRAKQKKRKFVDMVVVAQADGSTISMTKQVAEMINISFCSKNISCLNN